MFVERLREVRERSGLRKIEAAQRLGIARSYYTELEAGKYTPSLRLLVRLADLFNVSVDYLLGRSEGRRDDSAE